MFFMAWFELFVQAVNQGKPPNFLSLRLPTENRANTQWIVYGEIVSWEATCNHEDSLGQ